MTVPDHSHQTKTSLWLALGIVVTAAVPSARSAEVMRWDFRQGLQGWKGNAYTAGLRLTREGMAFQSTGIDPWIEGPPITVPSERITRVVVRMLSRADTGGELFYGPAFQAGRSVRFVVLNDGQWHDYDLIITESLGANTRFRLDPAAGPGPIEVQSITVESLRPIPVPPLAPPALPETQRVPSRKVTSGDLQIRHHGLRLGNFEVRIAGTPMAVGYASELLGLLAGEEHAWLNLGTAPADLQAGVDGSLSVRATLRDEGDGTWSIERLFRAGAVPGTVTVTTRLTVDRTREVVLMPWLTLYAGLGSYRGRQGPGSAGRAGIPRRTNRAAARADITTRRTPCAAFPDPLKVTFPLMALSRGGRCLGLAWQPSEWTNALFDSPDRLTHSDAHLMGVTGPAVGARRFENDPAAFRPVPLAANETVETTVTILGRTGATVIPAVQGYLEMHPLPGVPDVEGGFPGAVSLLAHGWLDSDIQEDGLFRHALWQGKFKPAPAADAAAFMDWLATSLPAENPLIDRLTAARDRALTRIPDAHPYTGAVSHVRLPSPSLRFGRVDRLLNTARAQARNRLQAYTPEGAQIYRPGDTDLGTTHFADHANGQGARNLVTILEAAALCLDPDLVRDALALLDRQASLYGGTVPRGAQTWEVPLHTPDIMASAHLTWSYVLGTLLSGDEAYLDQARYWAWTGVPFVYLADPTPGPVGRYATIPVFGATHWVGSWFGRPVQWCGLVYASALHRLHQVDPEGPWQRLALGITASGLQQCWTTEDELRQGLLPDFYYLRPQIPDGPAINPGTVQAHLPELFNHGALYDVRKLPDRGWILHAPCSIGEVREEAGEVRLTLSGWGALRREEPYHLLIAGLTGRTVRVLRYRKENGSWDWQALPPEAIQRLPERGCVLRLRGPADLRIRTGD
jgi:hypothetical protein